MWRKYWPVSGILFVMAFSLLTTDAAYRPVWWILECSILVFIVYVCWRYR